MNDATVESLPLLVLQSYQNNAVSELRRAMSSLRLVESYLNQGELLLRSLIRDHTPSDEERDQLSDLPIQETKRAHPLRRIRTRIPPPSITDSLKAEIEAAGLSIHQGEPAHVRPAPSSPKVKSTMFLVIEDGVATRHQLSNPLTRNKREAKKNNFRIYDMSPTHSPSLVKALDSTNTLFQEEITENRIWVSL
ncbi:hypothetical protein ARMSODRAFT_976278 [Armillaria solidipes]|uniref:Uncharacterized protein n=1 Tax=Armillaria solidipes TaxID=1076256 RepID=A0A2H3BLY3_9AGAR|nr:hypothetical protein ARMSODRAFT_976278 [Armillaria solidipes]